MAKFRINISQDKVVDWIKVTRKLDLYDYTLIKQYGSFVHFDSNKNLKAYLCKAPSQIEAIGKAQEILKSINSI